ncbi:MAG: cell wall metabolism sensor histidine kinase WalK, partial [Acidobacteriia bacterium]|nr:cell wall metabolism sensor histidine kinase WalK [Terriglobia bacterium]
MPELERTDRNQDAKAQADTRFASRRFEAYRSSPIRSGRIGPEGLDRTIALLSSRRADDNASVAIAAEDPNAVSSMRVNWQLKTIWPVAVVLLAGMLLFLLSTLSLQDTERHRVLVIAGAGAVTICGVIIVVLASTIQRPMIELQEQMERVGEGNLAASVSFARRNDEIGDLGRNFNRMVQQLRESREEIEHLHRNGFFCTPTRACCSAAWGQYWFRNC